MKLRIWHIPQVPMKAFHVEVSNIDEAWKILNTLWNYDLFQYENKVKPDYCNMSGLEYFDEEEKDWLGWEDEDGYNIKQHFENLKNEEDREMTNGDKIRNMSNNELAFLINESRDFFSCKECNHEQDKHCQDDCLPYIKKWLESESD